MADSISYRQANVAAMAEPRAELPTRDELAILPPRALAAYATRYARRVEPLFLITSSPTRLPFLFEHAEALDNAIALVEKSANAKQLAGDTLAGVARRIAGFIPAYDAPTARAVVAIAAAAAYAAAYAADGAAKHAAATERHLGVAEQAAAELKIDRALILAARADFTVLQARDFQPNEPVDATERGVCGPLWKGEPPHWYVKGLVRLREIGLPKKAARRPAASKSVPATEREREQLQAGVAELRDQLNLRNRDFSDFRQQAESQIKKAEAEMQFAKARATEESELRAVEERRHRETKETLAKLKDQIEETATELDRKVDHAQSLFATAEQRASQLAKQQEAEAAAHQETKATLVKVQQDHLKLEQIKRDLENKLSLIETERDLLKVQPLSWYTKLFFRPQNVFRLVTLLVLGLMVLFALFSISEVYERQALDRWIRTKADEQRDRIANGAVAIPDTATKPLTPQQYDAVRSQVLILSFAGAKTPADTVSGIREVLQTLLASHNGSGAAPNVAGTNATDGSWWHWLCHWLSYQSSDLLLSLVILFSGTVGAVITTMRKDQALSLRDVGQGFAAGFITFLAVRGGKSVFLLDADPLLLINPYNSAFFGLLAGMFTELAYELLTSVAQDITNRLKGAVGPNNGNSTANLSPPSPPKPALE